MIPTDADVKRITHGTHESLTELLDRMLQFLNGITWTDQDAVMRQREPTRWNLVLLLDGHDRTDLELRMFVYRLELEALLQHPDVLVTVARRFHEYLLAVAPDLPALMVAQQDQ